MNTIDDQIYDPDSTEPQPKLDGQKNESTRLDVYGEPINDDDEDQFLFKII